MNHRLFRPLLLLVLLASLAGAGWTAGQEPVRLGVVLPGPASASSANWNEVLSARAWEKYANRRSSGVPLELHFRDGGSSPANTTRAVRELVEQENVHAVVCCVTTSAAAAVAPFAHSLPIVSLARPNSASDAERSPLILPPSPLAQARAITNDARRFGRGVALLTLDNQFGRRSTAAVVAGLVEAGLPLARAETYSPGARALTPEGLLLAASDPGSVIVWGLSGDALLAIAGLRERGYSGPVYLPWSISADLWKKAPDSRLNEVRMAVLPVVLADQLPAGHPNSTAVRTYRRVLMEAYGGYLPTVEGALVFDALELLLSAAELALVYGVQPSATGAFRLAVSDALVALEPVHGAAGSYDYDGRNPELAMSDGIAIAVSGPNGLRRADR